MSALSTIEAGFDQVTAMPRTKAGRRSRPGLQLVTGSGQATSATSCGPATGVGAPSASPGQRRSAGQRSSVSPGERLAGGPRVSPGRRSSVSPAERLAGGARVSAGQRPADGPRLTDARAQFRRQESAPLRLTRRGRLVVGVFAVLLATVALSVIATAAAGRAQASNHGRDGAGYQGMHQIVVQPGETLWTIASQAEPSADPRQVVAEIMTVNSMSSTVVQAGQLLWVPR
jgi:hypothetical protein